MKYISHLTVMLVTAMFCTTTYTYTANPLPIVIKQPVIEYQIPTYQEYARSKGELVYRIVQRESGFQNIPCNWQKGCPEFGTAQYIPSTFKENCTGDYWNGYDQINCLDKMLKEGKGNRWTTLKQAKRDVINKPLADIQ